MRLCGTVACCSAHGDLRIGDLVLLPTKGTSLRLVPGTDGSRHLTSTRQCLTILHAPKLAPPKARTEYFTYALPVDTL